MSLGISATGWALGGAVLGSAYLGSKASKDAAATMAGSADAAAQLQYEQYLQTRQDLSPYREVATGEEIYGNRDLYEGMLDSHNQVRTAVYNGYVRS